jgi:hypothetical protein
VLTDDERPFVIYGDGVDRRDAAEDEEPEADR